MKKLFIAISFLFLTIGVYAKDFIIPDIDYGYVIVKSQLDKNYEIDTITDNFITYKTDNLYYVGRRLINIMLIKTSEDGSFALNITFQDMSNEDWINTMFTIMQENELVILQEKLQGDFCFRNIHNDGELIKVYLLHEANKHKSFGIIKM